MIISEEKIKEAERLLDFLGENNRGIMGLSSREEGIMDTLLWLIGEGEPLDELQDIED